MIQLYRFLSLLVLILIVQACSRPIAQFSYNGEPKAPAEISFVNESEKAERYEWDFGDGVTSQDSMPTHRYRSSGNYLVQLRAFKGKKARTIEKRILIQAPEECLLELETAFGNMLIQLYDETPKHRDNFVKLAEQSFFDSLLFHRVIKGFMVQGGDPKSKNAKPGVALGTGGPGYTVSAEFVDTLVHVKGALAAARRGDQVNPKKESSGSQFYIVHGRKVTGAMLDQIEGQKGFRYSKDSRDAYLELGGTPFLDKDYTVFGRVIEGLDIIDKIAGVKTVPGDRPQEDVWMKIRVVK